jgi:hypothetical protein
MSRVKFVNKGEKPKVYLKQTGSVKSLFDDSRRVAMLPGKRISKSGKIYWETRKNRSDAPGSRI